RSCALAFSSAFRRSNRSGSISCGGRTSIRTQYNIFHSAPCVTVQLVLVQDDSHARSGGQAYGEIFEAQRLRHQVVGKNLRPEVLASPFELAEGGEDLQMRRRD